MNKVKIVLNDPAAKIEKVLKEAYAEGYDDGVRYGGGAALRRSPKLWPESVTFARRVQIIQSLLEKKP